MRAESLTWSSVRRSRPAQVWRPQSLEDLDFPPLARRYGRAATAVLLAPAWDFGPDGWLHSRMAIWRGVESGFTVVRAAKQGQLVVSDAYGRVLAEAASTAEGFARLSTSAPARHVPTLYSRWGDWFGWLAVAIVVACIGRLIVTLAAQRSAVTPSRRAIPSLPS